ncbi:MAG: response regulator [Rhodanobacteraceae bacterium]
MAEGNTTIRVLVVEDSELDAELVLDELGNDGMSLEWRRVENEREFLAALVEFGADIIISDVSMPHFSGYRALEISRERVPDTPFIFVSGTMGEEAAVEAVRRGATDYVLKHNLARLVPSFRRALREAEERSARSTAEKSLLRAQRYEGLALLASGLSHDLRNVLQPITMGASMLLEVGDERTRKVGLLIQDCAARGLDIINSMLTFARGARGALERVKVRTLLEGLALLLRGSAPRTVELAIVLPDEDIELEGNYTELQQCLLNLCLNALQAMPDGGKLDIGTASEKLDGAFFIETEAAAPGTYLRISISDTGIGMSDEVKANLFKAFFTTKKDGTGLGLLSCRRILDNHKSYLRVDSAPGKGSTFSLYFPLATVGANGSEAHEPPQGAGQRVLVVMEEASTLSLLSDILRRHSYTVSAAQSGTAALQEIEAYGLPELVIMEAEMSLMTGVRTLSALLDREYAGPVIMLVRQGAPKSMEDLPPVQRIRFVEKPIEANALLNAVAAEIHSAPSND